MDWLIGLFTFLSMSFLVQLDAGMMDINDKWLILKDLC